MATSIRLDPAIAQRLDQLATQTGRTKAYYLRELVTQGLDALEDFYLTAATMERVRKGEENVYSAAQVRLAARADLIVSGDAHLRNLKRYQGMRGSAARP